MPGVQLPIGEDDFDPEPLARDIGAFLVALHSFPSSRAATLGLPGKEDFLSDLEQLRPVVSPLLKERLTAAEHARLERWWDQFFTHERRSSRKTSLIHGDFWPDNILTNTKRNRVLGVIDFADAMLGDPAHDLATLRTCGERFMRACVLAYVGAGGDLDDDFETALDRYWQLRSGSFYGLRAAILADDEGEVTDSLTKLRRSTVLVG